MGDYFSWVAAMCIIIAVATVGFGGYWDYKTETKRKEIATELGCRYVESARDLRTIAFYECNGVIVAKEVK